MNLRTMSIRTAAVVVTLAVAGAPVALARPAGAVTAADTVIAADPSPAPAAMPEAPVAQRVVGIDATIVNGLSVSGAQGAPVTLTARGQKARTVTPAANAPAVFRQLTAGATYTVSIDGARVGTGVPVAAVGPAYGLTVSTTATADEVLLRWNHRPAKGQGQGVSYDVVATPVATIGRTTDHESPPISGTATATVTAMALDPTVKYTISVTPRNSASTGTTSTATMTRTLAEMGAATAVPTTPSSTPGSAPPAPAPPAAPATQTIYACPSGFTETSAALCRISTPYTYDTKPYTYHWGVLGSHDVADAYAADMARSTGTYCPWGGTFDGGLCTGATYHRVDDFGDIKDPTPTGYTDNGTTWSKKNDTPTGYTDDGAQWVRDAAKVAHVLPT